MYYTYLNTPVGRFFLAGDVEALFMTSFFGGHQQRGPEPGWVEDPAPLRFAIEEIEEYFSGQRTHFDIPLATKGTDFQQEVWRILQAIPFGEAWTYGQIAEVLGKPGASRAVGGANAANILPLIIPCHRVVGADGTLTGFGGGLGTKERLLRFEGALPGRQTTLF